jgi:predicted RNA-binding protein with PIN domain
MRWVVDGMNVIGTRPDAWWRNRHAAMVRLVDSLERWAAARGDEVTVVFERPPSPPITSPVVEVAHAPRPRPNAADDEILRRLAADPEPDAIRVVTSDRGLADQVRAAGAAVEPAESFRRLLDAA